MGFSNGSSHTSCVNDACSTALASWKLLRKLPETASRNTPETKNTQGRFDDNSKECCAMVIREGSASTNQLPVSIIPAFMRETQRGHAAATAAQRIQYHVKAECHKVS